MPAKLTRKQIKESLEQTPIESVILGSQSRERTLTAKQKAFARNIALGKTGAQSYREVYSAQGKPKTIGDNASRLKNTSGIQAEIQAYTLALESAKYRTATQLRELVIHRLTIEAMSADNPPATRVAALKLLGTVSEVGAFTERKEVTTVTASIDIKSKLMGLLSRTVDMEDVTPIDDGQSLLDEIKSVNVNASNVIDDDNDVTHCSVRENVLELRETEEHGIEEQQGDRPTTPPPGDTGLGSPPIYIHTIPHKGLPEKHKESPKKSDGEGVDDFWYKPDWNDLPEVPPYDSDTKR